MDKSILKKEYKKAFEAGVLPEMNPDIFDEFVTYLYERVDLRSFERSDFHVKIRYYKQFMRQLPPDLRQFKIQFPQ